MSKPDNQAGHASGTLIQPTGFNYRQLVARVMLVLLNLGSLALLGWILQWRLLPLQRQTRELTSTVARLSTAVGVMETMWTRQVTGDIRSRFEEARNRIFHGRGALEAWLGQVQQQVVPLALEVELEIAKADPAAPPSPQSSTNNSANPLPNRVVVAVRPAAEVEAIASPFQRILQFGQQLTGEERRVDLVGFSVIGGLNSISRAVFELNVWTGEEGETP